MTFTAVSLPPGVNDTFITSTIFPLTYGYETIYNVSYRTATLLMVPTLFSSAMGFAFASGRQMDSMARSGLLPKFLTGTCLEHKSPIAGIAASILIGFICLLLRWFFDPTSAVLSNLCIVGACLTYIGMLASYILFRHKYSSMVRTFTSPVGIVGAAYAITYFAIVLLSMLFVTLDASTLITFAVYVVCIVVYYFAVVEPRQFFSDEEQENFLKVYVLNG